MFKSSVSESVFFFSCKIDFRESVTKPINHLDITQIKQVKNHSKTEVDFNHLGMEEESDSDNETPSELGKMASELEDKPGTLSVLERVSRCVCLVVPRYAGASH